MNISVTLLYDQKCPAKEVLQFVRLLDPVKDKITLTWEVKFSPDYRYRLVHDDEILYTTKALPASDDPEFVKTLTKLRELYDQYNPTPIGTASRIPVSVAIPSVETISNASRPLTARHASGGAVGTQTPVLRDATLSNLPTTRNHSASLPGRSYQSFRTEPRHVLERAREMYTAELERRGADTTLKASPSATPRAHRAASMLADDARAQSSTSQDLSHLKRLALAPNDSTTAAMDSRTLSQPKAPAVAARGVPGGAGRGGLRARAGTVSHILASSSPAHIDSSTLSRLREQETRDARPPPVTLGSPTASVSPRPSPSPPATQASPRTRAASDANTLRSAHLSMTVTPRDDHESKTSALHHEADSDAAVIPNAPDVELVLERNSASVGASMDSSSRVHAPLLRPQIGSASNSDLSVSRLGHFAPSHDRESGSVSAPSTGSSATALRTEATPLVPTATADINSSFSTSSGSVPSSIMPTIPSANQERKEGAFSSLRIHTESDPSSHSSTIDGPSPRSLSDGRFHDFLVSQSPTEVSPISSPQFHDAVGPDGEDSVWIAPARQTPVSGLGRGSGSSLPTELHSDSGAPSRTVEPKSSSSSSSLLGRVWSYVTSAPSLFFRGTPNVIVQDADDAGNGSTPMAAMPVEHTRSQSNTTAPPQQVSHPDNKGENSGENNEVCIEMAEHGSLARPGHQRKPSYLRPASMHVRQPSVQRTPSYLRRPAHMRQYSASIARVRGLEPPNYYYPGSVTPQGHETRPSEFVGRRRRRQGPTSEAAHQFMEPPNEGAEWRSRQLQYEMELEERELERKQRLEEYEARRANLIKKARENAQRIMRYQAQLQLSTCSKCLLCCISCGKHRWLYPDVQDKDIVGEGFQTTGPRRQSAIELTHQPSLNPAFHRTKSVKRAAGVEGEPLKRLGARRLKSIEAHAPVKERPGAVETMSSPDSGPDSAFVSQRPPSTLAAIDEFTEPALIRPEFPEDDSVKVEEKHETSAAAAPVRSTFTEAPAVTTDSSTQKVAHQIVVEDSSVAKVSDGVRASDVVPNIFTPPADDDPMAAHESLQFEDPLDHPPEDLDYIDLADEDFEEEDWYDYDEYPGEGEDLGYYAPDEIDDRLHRQAPETDEERELVEQIKELEAQAEAAEEFLKELESKIPHLDPTSALHLSALHGNKAAQFMVGRMLVDPMSTLDPGTARSFRPIQCFRQIVERPFQILTTIIVVIILLVLLFVYLWRLAPSFIKVLWSDFPLQIEDSSINGGYLRSLGVQAAIAEQNITRSLGATTELTQAFLEREVELVYKISEGDVFNTQYLTLVYEFEQSIREAQDFQRYCLLDWGDVGVSKPVLHTDNSPVIDPISQTPVESALQNLDLLRRLRAEAAIGVSNSIEHNHQLLQVIANLESFSQLYQGGAITPQCSWPNGPLRPASVYDANTGKCTKVPGSTPAMEEPIPGTTICQPMGLLTPTGELDEAFKNERLLEYSTLSRDQAPDWYQLVDKAFGPTASAFRSRFRLGWPLPGFNTTAERASTQQRDIGKFVVNGLIDRLLLASDNPRGVVFTFEALESGALDGLFTQELENSIPLLAASFVFIWLSIAILLRSSVMATGGVVIAVFAVVPAFLLYRLSGFNYFGLYHALSLLLILFVTVDSVIRFTNRWEQAERIYAPIPILIQSSKVAEDDSDKSKDDAETPTGVRFLNGVLQQALTPIRSSETYQLSWTWRRLSWSTRHALRALLIACCTLGFSLVVNVNMTLPAFRSFAIFAALLSFCALLITLVLWPVILTCHRKYLDDRKCCLFVPREKYSLDLKKIDVTDESTRLTKSETFFFTSVVNFVRNNRWAILLVYFAIVGVFIFLAMGLQVDYRNVSSAIFIYSHPINRYNEVRSLFPDASNIQIGIAFGLDKNNPVDRSEADITDPRSFGRANPTRSYNTASGSFDLFRARECLIDVCEFISRPNDKLKLASPTAVSQPSCIILDLHRWLVSGESTNLGIPQRALGVRDPTLTESDFWKAYVVFLLYEREFCSNLGDVKDCWLKYQNKVSMLDLSSQFDVVNDYSTIVTRVISMTTALTQSRETEYREGIQLFYTWEEEFSNFLNSGSCATSGLAQHTGFQYGLSSPWDPWHFYFFQRYLTDEVTKALGLAAALCFFMVLVFTGDVFISFSCILFVGCVLAIQLGITAVMRLPVGMVTVFPLLVLPGIVMINLSHVAEGYAFSSNYNPVDRIREALTKNAFPALASALINMGACIFLMISKAAIFTNFAIIVFLVNFISLCTTLFVFPAYMMIFGVSGDACNIYVMIRRKFCRENLAEQMYNIYLAKEVDKALVKMQHDAESELNGETGGPNEAEEETKDQVHTDKITKAFAKMRNQDPTLAMALGPPLPTTAQIYETDEEVEEKPFGLSRRVARTDAPDSRIYDEYCVARFAQSWAERQRIRKEIEVMEKSTRYKYPSRLTEIRSPIDKTN